jgi:glycosyltransferase involved in cell wall biosynthesis
MRNLSFIRAAHSLHCNGYPVYDQTRQYNESSLLYLDSRMEIAAIINEKDLSHRLGTIGLRSVRLLYSGRYEPVKGADDAVMVAVECLRRGLPVEMDCYGQGTLKGKMHEIAAEFPDQIRVHDPVPYPELTRIAKRSDVFVCCHIQNDPSCTYLESMGAGLPIVGYDNRMWRRMYEESGAGFCSRMGHPQGVADTIEHLTREDTQLLSQMSQRALVFARKHAFEIEFKKRVDAINAAISVPT